MNDGLAGVLALQGAVEPHLEMLCRVGTESRRVRSPDDLVGVTHLILPGGESTTMLKLLKKSGLDSAINAFAMEHKPIWGICAGAILIAKEVSHPVQESLGLMDIHAVRNHYGCQLDSFQSKIESKTLDISFEAQFIRAPLLRPISDRVQIIATHDGNPVWLKQESIMATSFHVELGDSTKLHEYFLSL